ncbi:MAG: aldo/keto reductase [Pseudonocardiaceae bacterium]
MTNTTEASVQYALLGQTGLLVSRLAFGCRDRHQGRFPHGCAADTDRSVPPAHHLVSRPEPHAAGHLLDRCVPGAPRGPVHTVGGNVVGVRRAGGLGQGPHLGFPNWSAWKVAPALEIQKANGLAPFTHGQMHYSLLERDVVPMMQRYGLGMTVWSPLASGFLSGKYTRVTDQPVNQVLTSPRCRGRL